MAWQGAHDLAGSQAANRSPLLRKLLVKLIQRIGVMYLPPRIASWRYMVLASLTACQCSLLSLSWQLCLVTYCGNCSVAVGLLFRIWNQSVETCNSHWGIPCHGLKLLPSLRIFLQKNCGALEVLELALKLKMRMLKCLLSWKKLLSNSWVASGTRYKITLLDLWQLIQIVAVVEFVLNVTLILSFLLYGNKEFSRTEIEN